MADREKEISFSKLLDAIQETKEDLTKHIDRKTAGIETALMKIESSLSTLVDHVDEIQTRESTNQDYIKDTRDRVDKMEKLITHLKEKTDDLENRSRRSNIRIINVPEQAEGLDAAGFLEKFIPEILGSDNFTSPVILERAHRIGKQSARPRPLIAKFLNFTDKEKVLRLARSKAETTYENKRISFYPDYSADLQRRREAFRDVKRTLREMGVEYALLYPAQLRIKHQGSAKFFSSPAEAERFLKDLPNVHQFLGIKEELPPEEKKWSLTLVQEDHKPPDIKDDHEDAEIKDIMFNTIKSEDDKENPESSSLHHIQTEENTDPMVPEPDECLKSDRLEKSSDSSETDVSDGNWEDSSEPQPCLKAGDTICDVEYQLHTCSDCGKAFSHRKRLLIHRKIHAGERPFSCSYCDATFKQKNILVGHLRIHTGERPYSCSICGQSYRYSVSLRRHMKGHTGERPFTCSSCKATFRLRTNYLEHQRIHTGEKPFSCSVCNATFLWKRAYVEHKRIHTGERPFACTLCDATFKRKYTLTQHVRTHTGEKPFTCSVCGQKYRHNTCLNRHMRIHTGEKPYTCLVCKATFKWKNALTEHTRIHTGEKPFSCSVCGGTYRRKQDFVKHTRVHSGEKAFSCSVCGQGFTKTKYLNSHMKIHKGQEPLGSAVSNPDKKTGDQTV